MVLQSCCYHFYFYFNLIFFPSVSFGFSYVRCVESAKFAPISNMDGSCCHGVRVAFTKWNSICVSGSVSTYLRICPGLWSHPNQFIFRRISRVHFARHLSHSVAVSCRSVGAAHLPTRTHPLFCCFSTTKPICIWMRMKRGNSWTRREYNCNGNRRCQRQNVIYFCGNAKQMNIYLFCSACVRR